MLLMDASEKMDSLNLLRCCPYSAWLVSSTRLLFCSCRTVFLSSVISAWQRCTHCIHSNNTGKPRPLLCYGCCRWMAPIASLCLIPAVLILEPTVVRCAHTMHASSGFDAVLKGVATSSCSLEDFTAISVQL